MKWAQSLEDPRGCLDSLWRDVGQRRWHSRDCKLCQRIVHVTHKYQVIYLFTYHARWSGEVVSLLEGVWFGETYHLCLRWLQQHALKIWAGLPVVMEQDRALVAGYHSGQSAGGERNNWTPPLPLHCDAQCDELYTRIQQNCLPRPWWFSLHILIPPACVFPDYKHWQGYW